MNDGTGLGTFLNSHFFEASENFTNIYFLSAECFVVENVQPFLSVTCKGACILSKSFENVTLHCAVFFFQFVFQQCFQNFK